MLESLISIIIIIFLWYIAFDCNKRLSQRLSKKSILVFTSIIYFIIIMIYMYCNFDDCYEHLAVLNNELILLIILVPLVTITANLMFIHTNIPKFI